MPRNYWYPLSHPSYDDAEIDEAVDSMRRRQTTMGEKVARFEQQFAMYLGVPHTVMVNSGSSANLLLAFWLRGKSLDGGTVGGEVLVPAVTWPTQVWPWIQAGFRVCLVDVDPTTFNIDYTDLERKAGRDTAAISVVHLLGNPCDMLRVTRLGAVCDAPVFEDCCEALGAAWGGYKVGTFGDGASFSFFFAHHICTMEGGLIVPREPGQERQLRQLRAHGWTRDGSRQTRPGLDPRYMFVDWGFNVRPMEVQAAFGLHQMTKLESFNERRQRLADAFFARVDELPGLARPTVLPSARPSWFALPLLVHPPLDRDTLVRRLDELGVETRPIVTGNLARQPVADRFPDLKRDVEQLPGADIVHRQGFYVGLSPTVSDEAFDRLLETLKRAVK